MSSNETHRRKACRMCDEIFVNRTDQKRHEKMCTGEKPFVCGMCNETFFNQTDQKCQEKIDTGEKPFACRMYDEIFWNVMWRYTQEKSLQDVRWDLCQSDRPEMSWENVHRRKTIWMWDVQRDLCKSVLPEMSREDTHRRKSHLLYWSLLAPNCGKKISCSNMLKPNPQMKYHQQHRIKSSHLK